MPKSEITAAAELAEVLLAAQVGVLALNGTDGAPYALPVNFLYQDGSIYIHSCLSGHKLDCLAADPRACFTAWVEDGLRLGEQACDCAMHYRSVVARGTVRLLSDELRKSLILAALTSRYSDRLYAPPKPGRVAATNVLELQIEHLTGKRSFPATAE